MDLDVEFGFTSLICTKHVWFGGLKMARDFWLQDLINGLKSSKL